MVSQKTFSEQYLNRQNSNQNRKQKYFLNSDIYKND